MAISWEIIFHGVEVVVLIFGVAWPMLQSANRLKSILQDFPPHRHINGKILYPVGYTPTEPEYELPKAYRER